MKTRDVDEARLLIAKLAPGMEVEPLGADFELAVQAVALPRLRIFKMCARQVRLRGERRGFFGLTVILDGHAEIHDGVLDASYDTQYAHATPETDVLFDVRIVEWVVGLAVTFDPGLIEALAHRLGLDPAPGSRRLNLASRYGAALRRHLLFVWRELQRGHAHGQIPQAVQPLEELLGSSLLVALQPPPPPGSGDLPIERAKQFLRLHLTRPVTVAEVATACGRTERSLFRDFRREFGEGPMGWLARRRLESAHQALVAGDPAATTVAKVAVRFGFRNLGRFSATYRDTFGEFPAETLRDE